MGDIGLMDRQNTVESLGELPDLDFLTVPVDDYFGSYVAELGARGQQDMDVQPVMAPSPFSALPVRAIASPSRQYISAFSGLPILLEIRSSWQEIPKSIIMY